MRSMSTSESAANAPAPRPRHRWFATAYDLTSRLSERRLAPLRKALLRQAVGQVLEIGCGNGLNFAHYNFERVVSLDATEPDPFMLRRARPRLEALPPEARSRVTLTEAPAEALPFPDGSFDTVVSTLVLCTVSDLDRSLAEIYRVLKTGGMLLFLEHVRAPGMRARVQALVQPAYGWFASGCHLTRNTEAALRAAGFEVDVWRRTSFGPLWPVVLGVAIKRGLTGEDGTSLVLLTQ